VRALLLGVALAVVACGPREPRERQLRLNSSSYSFRITPSEAPPRAREAILYRIVVLDRKSRQPIETGEGQIYANNEQGASTWDGLTKAAELGTYFGKLNFVTAEMWAVAVRFRSDSLRPLEKVEWLQDVINERAPIVP
jgi:hypothetical protein